MIPNKDQMIVSLTEPTGTNRKKVWIQRGKNLFNSDEKKVVEAYQATYKTVNFNGKKQIEAKATSIETSEDCYVKINPIYLEAGTYAFHTSILGMGVGDKKIYKGTKLLLTYTGLVGNFTLEEDAQIYFEFHMSGGGALQINDIQVERGTKYTAYEEYVKPTIYIKNDDDVYEEFIKNEEERINITTEIEYATNEYIDGNRVYRKRILLGNGPDDSSLTKTYPIGIEASNIIKTNVIMKHATLAIPLPIVSADTKAIVNYYMDGTNIIMQAGRDRSSFVVRAEIYYIKQESEE